MALSSEQPDFAKRIRLYKNGDIHYCGKPIVVNKRRYKTLDSFLQQVTNEVKSDAAVRSIRTPVGGSTVHDLSELEDRKTYVAVSGGRFQKIKYEDLERLNRRKPPSMSPREVKPVQHSSLREVKGRYRTTKDDMQIFIYQNGDPFQPAKRMILNHHLLSQNRWGDMLDAFTVKMGRRISQIFSIDGAPVRSPELLKKNESYVVGGSRFVPVSYGSQPPAFTCSPKQRRLEPINASQRRGRKMRTGSEQTGSTPMDSSLASSSVSEKSPKTYRNTHVNRNRPPPVKRAKPKQAKEREEDSVFHAKPVQHKRTTEVDYDKDEGGVFKAKGGSGATRDAQEVEETRETQVDLPIDQVQAEEVQDEEIYDEDQERRDRSEEKQDRTPTPKERTPTPKERTPTPKKKKVPTATLR